jgi:hypothetical protein
MAYLINHFGYAPYRDFLDANLPSAYLINVVIMMVTNGQPVAIRIFDILYLGGIMVGIYGFLQKVGKFPAALASLLFAFFYLSLGPEMTLQREFLQLLPLSIAIWLITYTLDQPNQPYVNWIAIGCALSFCLSIKPQLGTILIPLGLYVWFTLNPNRQTLFKIITGLGIGASIVIGLIFAWLALSGSLPAFFDVLTGYWPLYLQMLQSPPPEREYAKHLIEGIAQFGGNFRYAWVMLAFLGIILLFIRKTVPRFLPVLIGLAVACIVTVVIGGKFWTYHWLSFYYFLACILGLCVLPNDRYYVAGQIIGFVYIAILIGNLVILAAMYSWGIYLDKGELARVNNITEYLTPRIQPTDRVQVLDSAGGGLHILLKTRTQTATRYLYNFYFHHHVSTPYIKGIKADFIAQMELVRPRYIIRIDNQVYPYGDDVSREFAELTQFIDQNYQLVLSDAQFRYELFERRP